jgi:hypothetical protein
MGAAGQRRDRAVLELSRGAIYGAFATVPMSLAFGIARAAGAIGRLPPRLIVDELLPALPQPARAAAEWVLHFGYGAGCGAAYALLVRSPARGAAAGTAFRLAVWGLGYEGWVPLIGVLPPAHRDDRSRAASILVAHVVYGAALGLTARAEARRAR